MKVTITITLDVARKLSRAGVLDDIAEAVEATYCAGFNEAKEKASHEIDGILRAISKGTSYGTDEALDEAKSQILCLLPENA